MTIHNVASDAVAHQKLTQLFGREPTGDELAAAYVGAKIEKTGGDAALWIPRTRVIKYEPGHVRALTRTFGGKEPDGPTLRMAEYMGLIEPDEVTEAVGNLLVNTGLTRLTSLMTGAGGAAMTNAQTFAGVGDSTTAAAITDTALGAATNKYYQAVDATYPTTSLGVITNNCTFASANGNYVWNEWVWGIATGTLTAGTTPPGTSPNLFNHKVYAAGGLGTKVSGAAWTLQATMTIA